MASKKERQWHHQVDVVGLGFRMKAQTRTELDQLISKKGSITGMRLEREPDNPADSNAIKVMLPERVMHGMHIGYLRAPSAALLAPKLDRGSLRVVRASLAFLYADDALHSGAMDVTFADVKVKA